MKKKIKAIYDSQPCQGEIDILSNDSRSVYAKWIMYDNHNSMVTSFTNKYFIGDEKLDNIEIFNMIASRIQSYRIGRKRIFTEVKVI